jgi:vanillin dehydrogenase
MYQANLLIGGTDQPSSGAATFVRESPITGLAVTTAAAANVKDAERAVAAAQAAFPAWSTIGPSERRARLLRAADVMEQHAPEFVERGVAETGAAPGWIGFNVALAAGMLREAASMTTQIAGEIIPSNVPGNMAMAFRQPCGVVLGIAPWNAPVILGTRAIAMPLACGNTVVLKASELCPAVHRLIGTICQEAELGDGVVNVVLSAPQDAPTIVEHLISNLAVKRVNFTGSTKVGRIIAEIAARHLKPVLLELGGKAPLLVLDDADLEAAVEAAAFGAFFNEGQICMSTERVVVDQAVADEFVRRFAARAASLSLSGPLASPTAAARIQALLEDAVAKGATIAAGGEVRNSSVQPTVIDKVTPDMRIYHEESFGPVAAVVRVSGVDEAVRVANDTEYGLSASVFGRDVARALEIARRIESGICHINGPTVHDEAQMPFGGVKASGYGRFGGRAAIAEFTDLRWITVQTTPRHYPI